MRHIPTTIVGILMGTAVSISCGTLLGASVVSDRDLPTAAPPHIRPAPALVDVDKWPPPDPLAGVSGRSGQTDGVLASGSSRL